MDMPTLISASSKIKGEFILNVDARIDGEVIGKVESDKTVVIGTVGFVKGFVRAENLVIYGRLEGNFIVSGATVLHAGSTIFGTLYTKVIDVKEGAILTAQVVTYDKLKPLDEAQIHMAEKMISVHPIRMDIPLYSNAQITFDEDAEIVSGDIEPVFNIQEEKRREQSYSITGGALAESLERIADLDTRFSPEPGQHTGQNFAAASLRNKNEEANPKSIAKSVIFTSLLEQNVQEDFSYLVNDLDNRDKQASTLPHQTESKNHPPFSFKSFKNLLSHSKTPDEKPMGKDRDQKNPDSNAENKSGSSKMNNGSVKKEVSIKDSIQDLPTTDYSSLYK